MTRYLMVVVTSILVSQAMAAPRLDNTSSDSVDIRSTIVTTMRDMDDIGLVIVWNGDESSPLSVISSCEWREGTPGSSTATIDDRHLTEGVNYLIFVCYNQEFDGLWGGKCSYKFQLKQDGKSIWSKTGRNRNNTPAIEYAKSFRLEVSRGGSVSISDEIPSKDLAHLQRLIDHLESELVSSAPKKSLQVMRAMDLAQTVLGTF